MGIPGPIGATGDPGPVGPIGPAGPGSYGLSAVTFSNSRSFLGFTPGDGSTWLLENNSTGSSWMDLSWIAGYPANVVNLTLNIQGSLLFVTVVTGNVTLHQTSCDLSPPAVNCGAPFVELFAVP